MRKIVTNYYNASNNFSSPVRREPKPYAAPAAVQERTPDILPEKTEKTLPEMPHRKAEPDRDTLLLLGMLTLLFLSDCEDRWLIVALGYLLLF